MESSLLEEKTLQEALGSRFFIKRIEVFESIDSTNSYVKKLLTGGVHEPTLIVAEEQTQGRGRFNRQWHSEKGQNLTFSLLVYPQIPRERWGVVPLCVAACVASAVEDVAGIRVQTKWPNDLLIHRQKFCGILSEAAHNGLVVGIGLNVNQNSFPPDLHGTSLRLFTGKPFERAGLLVEIVRRLSWLSSPVSDSQLETMLVTWKARCTMLGTSVRVHAAGKTWTGLAKGVTADGALLLEIDGGEEKVLAGDVTSILV